jgi:hypothetical protein
VVSLVVEEEVVVVVVVVVSVEVVSLVVEVVVVSEVVVSGDGVVVPGVVPAGDVVASVSPAVSDGFVEVAVPGGVEAVSEPLAPVLVSSPPGPGPGKPPSASEDPPVVHAAKKAHAPRTTIPRILVIVAAIRFARRASRGSVRECGRAPHRGSSTTAPCQSRSSRRLRIESSLSAKSSPRAIQASLAEWTSSIWMNAPPPVSVTIHP